MLCDACVEHFTFARPDIVECCRISKRNAIEYAEINDFAESHITTLRSELERYQQALDARTGSVFPRPWTTGSNWQDLFPTSDTIPVWQRQYCRTWQDVQVAASSTGCQLCATLVEMIQYATKGAEIKKTDKVISVWFVDRGSCAPSWLRFEVVREDSAPGVLLHFHLSVDGDENGESTAESCLADIICHSILVYLRFDVEHAAVPLRMPSGTSTEDEPCINFLSQTLADCLAHHGPCRPRQVDGWIPKRLLDVRPPLDGTDSIALVERADLQTASANNKVQYLTLSHVWGSHIPMTLTKTNYADMKKGLGLDALPQCFRDAVKVARRFGMRYLWIDALWYVP